MPTAQHYRLTIRQGATPGKVFELAREVMVIGRDLKCDIVLNDPEVSRNHTRLTAQPDGYLVEDLESTNGTFVNNQRVTAPRLLRPGDLLGLGENLVLEFGLSDAAAATIVMQQASSAAPAAEPAYAPPPTPLPDPYGASQAAWTPPPTADISPPPAPVAAAVEPPVEKKSNRNMIIAIVVVLLLLCCCCLAIAIGVIVWQYNSGNLTLPGTSQLLQLLI